MRRCVALGVLMLLWTARVARAEAVSPAARFEHGVVAADHPAASEAGAEMLRRGGNVVDAAVATSFALSVVRPASSGIGGGGFMVIWNARTQKAVALDYRERAPKQATAEMFVGKPGASEHGGLAVGVPGTVAGLCYALREYGTLDLPTVLAPAIRLCRDGVPVDEHDAQTAKEMERRFAQQPEWKERFANLWTGYIEPIRTPGERGQGRGRGRFHSPQLRTLERVAAEGRDGFYRGAVAEAIVAEVRRTGGILSLDDLAAMQPVVREPIRGEFGEWNILTMPPPSSGGIAIVETLGILSAYERRHPEWSLVGAGHNSPQAIHVVTEALKHAFADRAEFLGDADFVEVPVNRLLEPARLERLAGRIDPASTKPPETYGRFEPPRDGGTSHFSVMDGEGNAVACTETINLTYGSFVVVPEYGIVLNNEMDDFTAVPGKPNAFGLIQSAGNAVAPGKKPLSSMSPTIVFRKGEPKPIAAVGASGGPRIITTTLQVLLNVTAFELPPTEAVVAPRFHHQWMPDELLLEPGLFEGRSGSLEALHHKAVRRGQLAVGQLVVRRKEGLWGVSDPRKHGAPAGW